MKSKPRKAEKLYAFVDETGQDTEGQLFLVAITVANRLILDNLRGLLLQLERNTGKGKKKWTRTPPIQRTAYLNGLPAILKTITPVYWRGYREGTQYMERTAETVLAALDHRDPTGAAELAVIIDGLNWAERTIVARRFRQHGRKWNRLKGGRDGGEPLLRLTDALAGFIRNVQDTEPIAQATWKRLKDIFHEV